jgi:hypothetical protein
MMQNDDMEVIMYKILSYLYAAQKAGEAPREEDFCAQSRLFHIPTSYWTDVLQELLDNGYIKGVEIAQYINGPSVDASHAKITLQGVQFLRENAGMAKVREFLGNAFALVLEQVISKLI